VSYINTDNWHPFVHLTPVPGLYGLSGILAASGVIFFAYIVSTPSRPRPRNPRPAARHGDRHPGESDRLHHPVRGRRTVLTGMVSYKELNVAAPVALALDKYPGCTGWASR